MPLEVPPTLKPALTINLQQSMKGRAVIYLYPKRQSLCVYLKK